MSTAIDPQTQRYNLAVVIFVTAIWIIWGFGYQTTWAYMSLAVDGVVTSSRDVPSTGAPRYITEYLIKDRVGHEQSYVSGPTDASLPRSMPVGTHLRKLGGTFSYERDGQLIHEFPIVFYSGFLVMAGAGLVWAITQIFTGVRQD